jgi:L-iditol 2-dehydrogenase
MKALLLSAYSRVELAELPRPEIGAGDVLVRVAACGICGSDIHGFDGKSGRRIPPIVMGHEACGTVAAVGREVRDLSEGDRVTFESMIWCGDCEACRAGRRNHCGRLEILGVSTEGFRRQGAYAEFVALPRRVVYRIPDALPFERAALIEPVSVAVHAVARTPLKPGDTVVVVGSGMIGLLALQALRAAGAGRVLAGKLGAADGINPRAGDVAEAVRARTGGRGADAAMEVVGTAKATETAMGVVRTGGTVTLVGNFEPRMELPVQQAVVRELTLVGTLGENGEYPRCIELMASGAIDVTPLISKVAPLEEGPALFGRLHKGEPGLMKVILKP